MRILIVEDEYRLGELVAKGLREEGLAADLAATRARARELMIENPYDLVLLDLMLPDGDGLSLLRAWRREGHATPVLALTARDQRRNLRMRIKVEDRDYMVDEQRPQVVIGRADESDVVVRGNLISRIHARIEFSRNRFTLTDQSTNGTFLQINGQEETFVRRDSVQMKGEGMIGLGRVPDGDSPQTIRFVCEEY